MSVQLHTQMKIIPEINMEFPVDHIQHLRNKTIDLAFHHKIFLFFRIFIPFTVDINLSRKLQRQIILLILRKTNLIMRSHQFCQFFHKLLLFSSKHIRCLRFNIFLLTDSSHRHINMFHKVIVSNLRKFDFIFLQALIDHLPQCLDLIRLMTSSDSFQTVLLYKDIYHALTQIKFAAFHTDTISRLLMNCNTILLISFLNLPECIRQRSFRNVKEITQLL